MGVCVIHIPFPFLLKKPVYWWTLYYTLASEAHLLKLTPNFPPF
jgi:hypothetical protein